MLSPVLVCCPPSTLISPLSRVLVLLATAISLKVAYGVLTYVLCIFTCCYILVYNRHGYMDIVGRLAKHSMQEAVEEVQTLPEYSTNGEVKLLSPSMLYMYVLRLILANSGSSLMPVMTLLPTPIIPLCPAFLEGIVLAT